MTQSSFIGAMLLAGFVLFLAAKGRLSTYGAVLWGDTQSAAPTGGSSGGSGGGIGGTAKSIGKAVGTAAEVASVIGI